MRLLRTVTTIVALVVSGLALVAVAPAPPAVAAATSFSQGSLVVTESPTEVCTTEQGAQTESAWLRRFHLDELAIYGTFSPSSVTFGVGSAGAGSQRRDLGAGAGLSLSGRRLDADLGGAAGPGRSLPGDRRRRDRRRRVQGDHRRAESRLLRNLRPRDRGCGRRDLLRRRSRRREIRHGVQQPRRDSARLLPLRGMRAERRDQVHGPAGRPRGHQHRHRPQR